MTSSIDGPAETLPPVARSMAPHPSLRACVSSYVEVALDLQPGALRPMVAVGWDIANAPRRPIWNANNFFGETFGAAATVSRAALQH